MTSPVHIDTNVTAPRRLRSLRQAFVRSSAASLVIILQGLWAGVFLQHGGERDSAQSWIEIHARGGEVAIVLTLAVAAVGGLIVDASGDTLTAVHVPLALLIMGIAIWIPVRARHLRSHP
ncbi:MAG: hypothetical protein ABI083_13665 [Lapillicoccus sp.]